MFSASDPEYLVIVSSSTDDYLSTKETTHPSHHPTPDLTDEQIEAKIEDMIRNLKSILIDRRDVDKPPFISQIYGQFRKKYYNQLLECLEGMPFERQNKHKLLFYKSVDIGCQKDFEELFSIRDKYQEHIKSKEFKASAFNLHNSLNLACVSNSDLDLIRAEVMELSLDWYVAIDRAVDALTRCHLYGICKEFSYKDLYARIKAKHCLDKPQTWTEWFFSFWRSSIKFLLKYFELKALELEIDEADASLEDLLTYATCVACEQILEVYKHEGNHEDQKQNLLIVKDFVKRSRQNLDILTHTLCRKIEECFLATTKSDLENETKDIEALANCLFECKKEEILRSIINKNPLWKAKNFANYSMLNDIELVESVLIPNQEKSNKNVSQNTLL